MFSFNYQTIYPLNSSYVLNIINTHFKNVSILDFWHFKETNFYNILKNKSENNIIIIDDELFEYLYTKFQINFLITILKEHILNTNHVIIVKTKHMYNWFSNLGFTCIHEPYFDVYEIIISFKKINIFPKPNLNNSFNFNFLNRNYSEIREFFIKRLHREKILDKGYVTANFNFNLNTHIQEKLQTDTFLLKEFTNEISYNTFLGGDRSNYEFEGELVCFLNHNILEISRNVPGAIMVQVESCNPVKPNYSIRSPSEKTFMPFLTHRIPLIVGHENKINDLRKEGFDVFDDIVNHEYDYINCEFLFEHKVNTLIYSNKQLLCDGVIVSNNILTRLKNNQLFLCNEWINNKLINLLKKLSLIFGNVKDITNQKTYDLKYE